MTRVKFLLFFLVLCSLIAVCQLLSYLIYSYGHSYFLNQQAYFALIFDNRTAAIIAVAFLLVLTMLFSCLKRYSLILAIAGSVSNLIDRSIYGGVVDYFNFFHIFRLNLADILICFGLIWFLYESFWPTSKRNFKKSDLHQ